MYADRPNTNNVAPPPTHQLLTVENNLKTGFNEDLTPPEDKNHTIFFGSVLNDNSTKSNQQAGSSVMVKQNLVSFPCQVQKHLLNRKQRSPVECTETKQLMIMSPQNRPPVQKLHHQLQERYSGTVL